MGVQVRLTHACLIDAITLFKRGISTAAEYVTINV